ncbi:MAG TPA: ABC transporter ATP-binding protein [Chloroflexi bacterium]|nr:ABC transporter ATP-binding protein [Chloroflexota bacterium]
MIELNRLSIQYGSVSALEETSLTIQPGEFVLITGPSGCGKTTLGRAITGLIPHAIPAVVNGSVVVNGLETGAHSLPTLAQNAGMVFQNPASQLFHLTVQDEVAFGPHNLGLPEDEVSRRVEWALTITGLNDLEQRSPPELSGGQQQRVAIAAALSMRPRVLVLDEPMASLDVPGVRQVMSALADLNRRHGITIILIEHRLAEAARLAGRVILMDRGRIVADGPPDRVLADRPLLRRLGIRRPTSEAPMNWERLLQSNGRASRGYALPSTSPLLELRDVQAGFSRCPVLTGVNLELYPGDFVALVGDNGAGKSTLGLVAAGLLKPQRGSVSFNGGQRSLPGLDVGLLFQNPVHQLFTDLVDDEVAFGPRNYERFASADHEQILSQADLLSLRNRAPMTLSAGQQQRLTLAATLSLRPKLVILDEPTMGQDWRHLQQLMAFVNELNRQGTAILLITHDYKLVHHYARRVALLRQGKIVAEGIPKDEGW